MNVGVDDLARAVGFYRAALGPGAGRGRGYDEIAARGRGRAR